MADMIFANPAQNQAADSAVEVAPGCYLGLYTRKSLEQLQEADPAIQLISVDEFVAITEAAMTTDPTEVDKAKFWDLLEVLPPGGWQRNGGAESFYMTEFYSGRVTTHVVRIGERYFTFNAPVMLHHADRTQKVLSWLEKNTH
jgi:hypothetical protein